MNNLTEIVAKLFVMLARLIVSTFQLWASNMTSGFATLVTLH